MFMGLLEVSVKQPPDSLAVTSFVAVDFFVGFLLLFDPFQYRLFEDAHWSCEVSV